MRDRDFSHVPQELTARPQWVAWRWELGPKGKPTKVPYDPRTRQHASTTAPATWVPFDTAVAALAHDNGYSGIGYVFSADDPYAGVDLDHCRDAATSEIEPWAQAVIAKLDTYTEVSPSGTGVHLLVAARVPDGGRKRGAVEMYHAGRYFTVTGCHLDGTPDTINARQDEIAAVHSHYFTASQGKGGKASASTARRQQAAASDPPIADDAELIRLAMTARNGATFARLWMGDKSEYEGDDSRADMALCNLLAFWTGKDAARMDRLFRRSELMRPKWERADYRERTISAAIDACTDCYRGPGVARQSSERQDGQDNASDPYAGNGASDRANDASGGNAGPARGNPVVGETWPTLAQEAYYGLAGDIVRAIEPHTEADPVALLVQFLVAFGNVAGRHAYFQAEADRHYPNLFAVPIGDTSKGRKGTSWGQVKRIFMSVADGWIDEHIISGLSSGEGLIHTLRDPDADSSDDADGKKPKKQPDPLQVDKRLLVREGEFAAVLKVMAREGNTLSSILRNAWDGDTLQALTKNAPDKASGAHISIIGHITRDELRRYLTVTEAANGFGNRFLWVCVRRSKLLPDGGALDTVDLEPLRARLRDARRFVLDLNAHTLTRDPQARALWHAEYARLSEGYPGIYGSLTARAEAQVMRLACVYALLDCSKVIRVEHLRAALAVWNYADASVRYVFGDALGDPTADTILHALRDAPGGMTRTEISGLFGRHASVAELDRALALLAKQQLARAEREQTEGRPIEQWHAIRTPTGAKEAKEAKKGQDGTGLISHLSLISQDGPPLPDALEVPGELFPGDGPPVMLCSWCHTPTHAQPHKFADGPHSECHDALMVRAAAPAPGGDAA